jgi:formate dehydrogenase (NADP+) beta subunit
MRGVQNLEGGWQKMAIFARGVRMERMEMAPDRSGCVGTGQFEKLKADSLVLAVGQHSDVEFLRTVPSIQIGLGDVIEGDASMGTGHPGIFAGGGLIGGARTMTTAVGHEKKAARNIDAFHERSAKARRSMW